MSMSRGLTFFCLGQEITGQQMSGDNGGVNEVLLGPGFFLFAGKLEISRRRRRYRGCCKREKITSEGWMSELPDGSLSFAGFVKIRLRVFAVWA